MTREFIELRAVKEANYILKNKCTIRTCAKAFGVSKSCVHLDVSYRLKGIDKILYKKVKNLLDYNFSVKHLRGGEAIKQKAKAIKTSKKWE